MPMMPFEGTCLILKAGLGEDNRLGILLKEPGDPAQSRFERWYTAKQGYEKEYLAIALTAISTNKRVFAKMADYTADLSTILYFGIEK